MKKVYETQTKCLNGNSMQLSLLVKDDHLKRSGSVEFEHTTHSLIRASQRGLRGSKIFSALIYGDVFHKQGLIYYVLGEHNIPDFLEKEKKKLKNIVVVVAGDTNKIITCYRSSNPFKHIRMKSKILFHNYLNAA